MPGLVTPLSQHELTIAKFEETTKHAAQVQETLLTSILKQNASCEYLQQVTGSRSSGDTIDTLAFKKRVPLVTHGDIQPFIQRIADGEGGPILTASPIEAVCLSSGTTGTKEKYLPYHEGLKNGTLEVARVATAFRQQAYPISNGARILEFLFCGRFSTTQGGLRAGTATTHMIRRDVFKQRQRNNGFRACSPDEVVLGSDCKQVMYCHLLCGLLFSEQVEVVSAPFAYTLVEALRILETEWEHLCNDIRRGQLNSSKLTDNTLRVAVGEILSPNPKLADELSTKCIALAQAGWRGVLQTLWPKCKYVLSIMTGAMEAYMDKLYYYGGDVLPMVSADYAATEGWIGVNVEPTRSPSAVSFTVLPTLAFFEFIPLYRNCQDASSCPPARVYAEGAPVGLTEVKVGQEYEIVMTTHWGLYRYRLGDVVRVTGFYNAAPRLAYVCRKNVMLSINIDKNTEQDLKVVVNKAAKRLGEVSRQSMHVVDYTSYAERGEAPGHYVIFWELGINESTSISHNKHELVSTKQVHMWLSECATLMDWAFVEPGYVTSRKMNTIAALELCVVCPGTFSKLLERSLSRGAAITQYKTPRCIVSQDALSILRNSTLANLHSSAYSDRS